MAKARRILLTGATGQVGGCVLERLVKSGHEVVCLARPDRQQSAAERIRSTLVWLGANSDLPFQVVEGDINQELLGLEPAAYRALADRFDLVIHSAARIAFKADNEGEPFRTNLHGTERMLTLARDAGQTPFCYVSTAYVCGNASGLVEEAVQDRPPQFKNAYEESKWQAEQKVWGAHQQGHPVCILRPSIVVGDSVLGRALHFQGFYLVCRGVARVCQALGHDRAAEVIRRLDMFLPGHPENPINLVPADYVSDAICHLATRMDSYGSVYHLTHPRPVSMQGIIEYVSSYFRVGIHGFAEPSHLKHLTHEQEVIGRLFWKVSSPLHDYFQNTPIFDCRRTLAVLEPAGIRPVGIDQNLVNKLLTFADMVEYGRKKLGEWLTVSRTASGVS